MVQQHLTCYDSSPHALSEVRHHLQVVKPDAAAAAPFQKLRGPPVARLIAADVGCSVPPVRESAAGYEPAAGHEPFLPAAAPRRLPKHAIARDTLLFSSHSLPTSVQPSVVLVSGVLGDMAPRGTRSCAGEASG